MSLSIRGYVYVVTDGDEITEVFTELSDAIDWSFKQLSISGSHVVGKDGLYANAEYARYAELTEKGCTFVAGRDGSGYHIDRATLNRVSCS